MIAIQNIKHNTSGLKMVLSVFIMIISFLNINAQVFKENEEDKIPSTQKEFEAQYQENIRKTKINGVYIPKDTEDALINIKTLATPEGLDKFKSGEEEVVVRKLKGGIGRWMVVNWNFYEGSRLSHHLKEKGVLHPEDMSAFLMAILHRELNNKPMNQEKLIDALAAERKKRAQEEFGEMDVLETQTKKIKRPEK